MSGALEDRGHSAPMTTIIDSGKAPPWSARHAGEVTYRSHFQPL